MNRNEELRAVYLLSQEFVSMLKERQVEALDSWGVSSESLSCDRTRQFCQWDSARLCRGARRLLFRVE